MLVKRQAKPHKEIYVIGAGGHGKVAIRAAQAAGIHVLAVFDDDSKKWHSTLYGAPVVGPLKDVHHQKPLPTLLAIGDNSLRLKLAHTLDLQWASVIHPAAYVDDYAKIGKGVLILPGAVVHADANVGDHAIVNSNATIEHDCSIGLGTHVACRACLSGGVQVGRGALIGAGAVVLPGRQVGDYSRVGAGAVVTREVPSSQTVIGVPARIVHNDIDRVA